MIPFRPYTGAVEGFVPLVLELVLPLALIAAAALATFATLLGARQSERIRSGSGQETWKAWPRARTDADDDPGPAFWVPSPGRTGLTGG